MNVFSATTSALLDIIEIVLNFYIWVIIVGATMSWLVAFNIVNTNNRFVHMVGDFLFRLTEPLLKPLRRVLPNMGGLDLSPLVLILIIMFIQSFVHHLGVG